MTVVSNDPAQPRFVLTMKGEVDVLANFEPERLSFGDVLLNTSKKEEVPFVTIKEGLEVVDVKATNAQIVPRLIKKKGKTSVEVTLAASDKPGRVFGNVIATTNQASPKEVILRVDARVSADLVLDRDRVAFAVDDEGKAQPVSVTLSSITGKRFKVKKVEDPKGAVTGKAERQDGKWQVQLELSNGQTAGNGVVQLHTNHDDVPVVDLHYVITKRPSAANLNRPPIVKAKPKPVAN